MSVRSLLINQTIKQSLFRQIRLSSCWSCGTEIRNKENALFCGSCNALQQPAKEENYFKIMGVGESYDLDETELAKKYKELQKYLHPDKFANRDKIEQEISEKYSSLVNEAYKTLLEPLTRGIYMLRLKGKEIPENTESVDKEFLMKIMEKNEEVENAETEKEIMELNSENKAKIKSLQKQVSTAFFDGDMKKAVTLKEFCRRFTRAASQKWQKSHPNAQFLNSYNILTRVIQGIPTKIDRYPILTQLMLDAWGSDDYVQHCAGVILTSRHVLSAAHCFQYNQNTGRNYSHPKYWKIRVGSTYRTGGGVLHNLKTIITHKGFDNYFYTHDIAIVVVSRQFTFNSNVKQGTIIKQGVEIKPDSLCTLVGWGVKEPDGPQPEQLQQTILYTIDQKICAMRYNNIGAVIQDSMMCAGRVDAGGPDGCFGDSGGPLIYKGLVVGIVSFGYSCGHRYFPGVYTKVSHYTNWVLKTVKSNK